MEYMQKPKQKLSLSSTFNQLNTALWQQKEKNFLLEKQNTILNTKISSIKKQNLNTKASLPREEHTEQKQRLRELYAQIKNQQQWIKEVTSKVEQKNFEKQYKRKNKIEKKLNKTNKKCKELNKKLHKIQRKVDWQQNQIQKYSQFLGCYEDNEEQKVIHPDDVFAELEKQNQQLNSLMQFKETEQSEQVKKVKSLNSDIIELLALKNWLRKYAFHSQKLSKQQEQNLYDQRPSSSKQQKRLATQHRTYGPTLSTKTATASMFKREPKLKITTY